VSAKYRVSLLKTVTIVTATVLSLFSPSVSAAADLLPLPDGSKMDLSQKCPVCGMEIGGKDHQGVTLTFKDGRVVGFHGVAAAVFKDGNVVGFDGARCLFIYNSVPKKYSITVTDIAHQYVTDYVSKKMIELPRAFLVLGSEVKGPMGYELVAFSNMEEASRFASENDGKWIVQLHEVARAGQKVRDDLKPKEKDDVPTADDKKAPMSDPEPSTLKPETQAVDRPQKRVAPQRRPESERYEPFLGLGHHGGMMH